MDFSIRAAYSTLLGAVRSGGFIPWDGDIDIVMTKKDYDNLKSLFNEYPSGHILKGTIHKSASVFRLDNRIQL